MRMWELCFLYDLGLVVEVTALIKDIFLTGFDRNCLNLQLFQDSKEVFSISKSSSQIWTNTRFKKFVGNQSYYINF